MLRLYWADVSRLSLDAVAYSLSAYRLKKLEHLRPEDARRQSIGAELLLRQALADCVPEIVWPPRITAGEHGKPDWDVEGLHFNLSHSGTLAACGISDRPVGVDVQEPCVYREALARRFFSAAEQEALSASEDRDRDFGRIWTRKEAYVKAMGTGLRTPLASFTVLGEGTPPGVAFWDGVLRGYHIAICLPGTQSAEPEAMIEKQLP